MEIYKATNGNGLFSLIKIAKLIRAFLRKSNMTRKVILSLAIVAAIVAITQVNSTPQVNFDQSYAAKASPSHNLIVGYNSLGDRRSIYDKVSKTSSWLRIVTITRNYTLPTNERITLVQALDQKTNGNGAYATLLSGGPGTNYASIRFKSQRSHGINFVVQIYSR